MKITKSENREKRDKTEILEIHENHKNHKKMKIRSGLPRAKGIIESINRTPVCNGSNRDCLSIIPSAKDSTT